MSMRKALPVLICLALALTPALAKKKRATENDKDREQSSRLSAETFAGLELRGIGPALMSGRIADIAIDPRDQSVWYVAAGSGGVWKTTNAGTSWASIFDSQPSYSIGCIALDPQHPDTVWVGTGENVSGRHVGFGDGIYRSTDGGQELGAEGARGVRAYRQHRRRSARLGRLAQKKERRQLPALSRNAWWLKAEQYLRGHSSFEQVAEDMLLRFVVEQVVRRHGECRCIAEMDASAEVDHRERIGRAPESRVQHVGPERIVLVVGVSVNEPTVGVVTRSRRWPGLSAVG